MSSGTAYRWENPARWEVIYPSLYDEYSKRKLPVRCQTVPDKASHAMRYSGKQVAFSSRLPLEICHMVLLYIDLDTIWNLRLVDRATKSLVDSLPEYSWLTKYAPETLQVIFLSQSHIFTSIGQLSTEFCQPWCRTCGDFGPLLYLPTVTRSCFKCNYRDPAYHMACVSDIKMHFQLTEKDLRSIPIIYSPGVSAYRMGDVTQAKALAIGVHGSHEAMKRAFYAHFNEAYRKYLDRLEEYKLKKKVGGFRTRRPRIPNVPVHLEDATSNMLWRLSATVIFPYWDRQPQTLEPGVYCRACTYRWEEKASSWFDREKTWDEFHPYQKAYYRAYLEAELPDHFMNCTAVKENYDFAKRSMPSWKRKGEDFIVHPKNAANM